MNFRSYFHYKWIPDRERERERESERKKRPPSSSPVRRSPTNPELQSAPIARTSRSRTAPRRSIARTRRSHHAPIAIDASRDRDLTNSRAARSHAPDDRIARRSRSRLRTDRDRRFARSASIAISRSTAPSNPGDRDLAPRRTSQSSVDRWWFFFLGFVRVFLSLSLLFFFSKHQKIFFGKFFEMQPNTWKHFPFRKLEYFLEMLLHEPNTALVSHKHEPCAQYTTYFFLFQWKSAPDFNLKSFLMTMQANLIGIPYFYNKSTIPNLLRMSTTQDSKKVDSSPK